MKHNWKPGNMIYPLPAVLVSCGCEPSEYNVLTVAWVGTLCTDVLYFGAAGTIFVPDYSEERGVRDKLDHEGYGVCHGLVWGTFREGL